MVIRCIFIILFFTGCAKFTSTPPIKSEDKKKINLTAVSFEQVLGWKTDNHHQAFKTFLRSCSKILTSTATGKLVLGHNFVNRVKLQKICKKAIRTDVKRTREDTRLFFERWFQLYQVSDGYNKTGLFTGYYEPLLRGSRSKKVKYKVPIYRRPSDLVSVDLGIHRSDWSGRHVSGRLSGKKLIPYFSRRAIDGGALEGKGLEIFWVDNAIDAFFLHIQGSGRILLNTGEIVRVGFAGRNGHPYFAVGRDLVKRGLISKEGVSLQTIREWLEKNPKQAKELMQKNRSYIFFKERKILKKRVPPENGPIGAAGVSLTPGRSLAVDRKYYGMGLPIWIDTAHPLTNIPLRRLMVAQDTGGAIVGPIRGDFFWGSGDNAREAAGKMKHRGQLYILSPRFVN